MATKQTENQNRELKILDLSQKKFPANGKTYKVTKSMSFERYRMYEKIQLEVGYGANFIQIYKNITKAYDLVNKTQFADTAVTLHNILAGIKTIESRQIPALRLCALFINADGEDENVITEEMIDEKIADWEAEGYDIFPFFQLAINSIPDFSIAFKTLSQLPLLGQIKSQKKQS